MTPFVQNLLVAACLLAAAAYVARRCWLTMRGRSGGCGIGCNSCPSKQSDERPLIQLSDFRAFKR